MPRFDDTPVALSDPPDNPEGRGPQTGCVRNLRDVGRIVCSLGLSSHPLEPWEVLNIERRALRKVKRGLRDL